MGILAGPTGGTRALTTTVVRGRAQLDDHLDAWEACHSLSPRPRYDGHPTHVTWTVDDVAGRELLTVLVHEDDRLVGVAPVSVTRSEVPWSVRTRRGRRPVLRFPVGVANLLGESFVGPADETVHAALVEGLTTACRDVDVIEFRHVATDTPLWQILNGGGPQVRGGRSTWTPTPLDPKLVANVGDDYDEFLLRIGRKARANIRREWRLLQAAHPDGARLEVVTDPADVPAFLTAAAGVSAHSWHVAQGANPLRDDDRRRDQLTFMAEHGWLRGYLLRVGEEPVACAIGYHSEGTILLVRIAHHERWKHLSPGKVMLHRIIADMCADPSLQQLDFGHGDWAYKRAVCDEERFTGTVRLLARRPRTMVVYSGPRAWAATRRGVLRALERSGALADIRTWTRKHLPR